MVYYNAFFIKYGYRQNPFEVPAYDQETRFLKLCEQYGLTDKNLSQNAKVLENISRHPDLIIKKVTSNYKENYFLLFGSFVFCLVVALIKPIADLFIFNATGLIHLFKKKKIKQP